MDQQKRRIVELEREIQILQSRLTNKKMSYVSERITNISDLENTIENAYIHIQRLRDELEKTEPSLTVIEELAKKLHTNILKAHDFEFCIERRTTNYCA